MACKFNYKGRKYTESEIGVVATLHKSIEKELKDSKTFRKKGKHISLIKSSMDKYNKGVYALAAINSRYKKRVVSSQSDGRIIINVTPLLEEYLDAHQRVADNEFVANEYITEEGDVIVPSDKNLYYQVDNKSMQEADKQLNGFLKGFLSNLGVTVNDLDNFKDRFSMDAVGVADLAKKVIYVSQTKEDITTLPEETGHFAIASLKDRSAAKRLIDLAEKSDIFEDVVSKYSRYYDGNINKLKEEAAGQLFSKVLIEKANKLNNPEAAEDTSLTGTIRRLVNGLWKNFTSLFKKESAENIQDQIDAAYSNIVDTVLQGDTDAFSLNVIDSDIGSYYQLTNEIDIEDDIKTIFIKKSIKKLEGRIQTLSRKQSGVAKSKHLEKELESMRLLLSQDKVDLVVAQLLNLTSYEIKRYDNDKGNYEGLIQKFESNGKSSMPPDILKQMMGFINIHGTMLEDLAGVVTDTKTSQKLDRILTDFIKLKQKAKGIAVRSAAKTLEAINTNDDGSKILEGFGAVSILETGEDNVSSWNIWAGNLKNSTSDIIKLVYKAINDRLASVNRHATRVRINLTNAQQKFENTGGKVTDIIETDSKGKYTHYLISEFNREEYATAKKAMEDRIAKELGIEDFYSINKFDLPQKQRTLYESIRKEFMDNNTQTIEDGEITKTVPAEKYRNTKFDKLMQNEAFSTYYNTYMDTRKADLESLPERYQTDEYLYRRPQTKKDIPDRVVSIVKGENKSESKWKQIQKWGLEGITKEIDDTEYGEHTEEGVRVVPIFYVNKTEDASTLTEDLTGAAVTFSRMSENFKQMNEFADNAEVMKHVIGERSYDVKGKTKKSVETKEYEALEFLINRDIFGEGSEEKTFKVGNVEVNANKLVNKMTKYSTLKNLAFNVVSSTAGHANAAIDARIAGVIGDDTTTASRNWATKEYYKSITHVASEIGKKTSTNKMHLFAELFNTLKSAEEIATDLHRNRAGRLLLTSDVFYTNFALADYDVKAKSMLSVLDNHRLVDGKFITKEEFLREANKLESAEKRKKAKKSLNDTWETYTTFYDVYEVDKENKTLKVKDEFKDSVTESTLNSITHRVNSLNEKLDGILSPEDKGKLQSKWWSGPLLQHKGWLVSGIDKYFKKQGINIDTGIEEVGYYRALGQMVVKTYHLEGKGIRAKLAVWDTLSEAERVGVRNAVLQIAKIAVLSVLGGMISNIAIDDDDDNWTIQYTAWQMNRILLEASAFANPGEFIGLLKEPAAGVGIMEDSWNALMAVPDFAEEVDRGTYKGMTQGEKTAIKMSPFKHTYEIFNPKEKNRFVRSVLTNPIYDAVENDKEE